MAVLRLGTRGSALARSQADRVRTLLTGRGVACEIVPIRTSGDEGRAAPPAGLAVKGLYTKEIEDALLEGRVDLAVHSLKDLMVTLPDGLVLAAFPEREDLRDALVSRTGADLEALPKGARVGTSSLRRRAAVLALRPDLDVVPLRGNVPTRIGKVDTGAIDAAILAMAGLIRLGLHKHARPLDPVQFVPAPGQGTIGVQARSADRATLEMLRPLDRPEVRTEVEAERAALARLEGGCRSPIGAACINQSGGVILHVRVYAPDGSRVLAAQTPVDPSDPVHAGHTAADELLARGAADLLAPPDESPRVDKAPRRAPI